MKSMVSCRRAISCSESGAKSWGPPSEVVFERPIERLLGAGSFVLPNELVLESLTVRCRSRHLPGVVSNRLNEVRQSAQSEEAESFDSKPDLRRRVAAQRLKHVFGIRKRVEAQHCAQQQVRLRQTVVVSFPG